IEIWNLVFIQFNANPDGTFSPLPAKHVDTGMGFERVTAIKQGTKEFSSFGGIISNYETDVFRPIFNRLEQLSGKKYGSTLPKSGSTGDTEQEKIDVAFRVIADHIRTLTFSIADGILPGNNDRNYVLRRILRRAVKYGRTLGFHQPFFYQLVDVLVENMSHVFPEVKQRQELVRNTIKSEEESFNKTLDRGLNLFIQWVRDTNISAKAEGLPASKNVPGDLVFKLYDTYGFPSDLTALMARESGYSVDVEGFDKLMEEQRARARASQKKEVISISHIEGATPTLFQGYDTTEISAKVLDVIQMKEKLAVILDVSPFYAEMGGQVGDTGTISGGGNVWHVVSTTKVGNTWVHYISESDAPSIGMEVELSVDPARRNAIQRHHTVTHLFHWALHEVVSKDAVQKGSFVGPEKLTFDFNSGALTPAQIRDIEKLVNERILENAGVSWTEIPYTEVKSNPGIVHLFGEKYGDRVRVVQIGGENGKLNGYSMELCGGTHTRATGEIGYFRITGESAVAAGIRRVEAVAGGEAYNRAIHDFETIHSIAGKLNAPLGEVEKKIDALLAHQKELEKQLKTLQQKQAAEQARALLQKSATLGKTQAIVQNLGEADGDYLQSTIDALKGEFKGVIVLTGATNGSVSLAAAVSPDLVKQIQAGKIIQAIAPIVGGKGGGRPEFARGAGKDASKIQDALRESEKLIAAL
ncbi:MAG: alanine--tRNA ligase, partial [Verrucomicrobiota bacterium]